MPSSSFSSSSTKGLPLSISIAVNVLLFLCIGALTLRSWRAQRAQNVKVHSADKILRKTRLALEEVSLRHKGLLQAHSEMIKLDSNKIQRQGSRVDDIESVFAPNKPASSMRARRRSRMSAEESDRILAKSLLHFNDKLKEVLIPSADVILMQMLGKGGNGEVYLAFHKGEKIAVKRQLNVDERDMKKFSFECFLMKHIRHPNIVKLIGVCWDEGLVGCCLEFVSNGTLEEWLRVDAKRKLEASRVEAAKSAGRRYYEDQPEELTNEQNTVPVKIDLDQAIYSGWKPPSRKMYTDEDLKLIKDCETIIMEAYDNCKGQKNGWVPIPLELTNLPSYDAEKAETFKSYVRVASGNLGRWDAVVTFEVEMRPEQFMAGQMHEDNYEETADYKWLEPRCEGRYRNVYRFVYNLPFLTPRELLFHGICARMDNGVYMNACESCTHDSYPITPALKRATLHKCGQIYFPIFDDDGVPVRTLVVRYNSADLRLPGLLNIVGNDTFIKRSGAQIVTSPYEQKLLCERILDNYRPTLPEGLKWKEHLVGILQECASVFQYLHNFRYYSDEEKKYCDCIIHRDLKPDNMLLTKGFSLKLADFGESRAADRQKTMSLVGTPLYIAPEVMRSERYDSKADVYSFGMTLLTCIRADKNLYSFLVESLRKELRRASRMGMGVYLLNNQMLRKNWRPRLPKNFVHEYPKLADLITSCWQNDPELRPNFDEIVKQMVDIRIEVSNAQEPVLGLLSEEDDGLYQASAILHNTGAGGEQALLQQQQQATEVILNGDEEIGSGRQSSVPIMLTTGSSGRSTVTIKGGESLRSAVSIKGGESLTELTAMLATEKERAKKIAQLASEANISIDIVKQTISDFFGKPKRAEGPKSPAEESVTDAAGYNDANLFGVTSISLERQPGNSSSAEFENKEFNRKANVTERPTKKW